MSRLAYQPALDGLRGIALASVLLFHAEIGLAPGAWGGVSTFFTLSGFLITGLLLREHTETGTISLRAFYERRARRLLPALALALGAVVVFGATVADATQLRDLRGDVLASTAYVANWRFALGADSYSDLFASPSPLLHFWTVAIEEQFYLLFPPLLAFVLARRAGRDPVALLAIAVTAFALVQVTSGLAGVDDDLIYFGTHTRASELLMGALLAALAARGTTSTPTAVRHLLWAGPLALLACIATWATIDQASDVLYRGGFAAYALLSATVIAAATTPGNPVAAILRLEPLRTLGRISYGVYLFHWPIYLWLTPERTQLDDTPLLVARIVLSVAAGLASFHLVEHPVRTRTLLRSTRGAAAAALAILAVLVSGSLVVTADPPADDLEVARQASVDPRRAPPNPPGVDAVRMAVFGDSAALVDGVALGDWMNGPGFNAIFTEDLGEPHLIGVGGRTVFHCGILGGTPTRLEGRELPANPDCDTWAADWEEAIDLNRPDVAIVQLGLWEVVDRKLPGDDAYRAPGDPVFDAALRAKLEAAGDLLLDHDLVVLWILAPHIETGTVDGVPPARSFPESDPARIDRFNNLVREVAADHPSRMGIIDLPSYLESLPGGEMDTSLRRDLVHFDNDAAAEIAETWLGPEIRRAYTSVTGARIPA